MLRHLPAKLSAPEIAEAIAVLAWIKFRPRRSTGSLSARRTRPSAAPAPVANRRLAGQSR